MAQEITSKNPKHDFFNRYQKILNFTHWDFDGACAAIVIENYYRNVISLQTTYTRETTTMLTQMKKHIDWCDAIVFTDFTPKESWEQVLAFGKPVLVLDHHAVAEEYNDPEHNIFINEGDCGTKMAYKFFLPHCKGLKRLEDLVELADDFDCWHLQDERSMKYNGLFWTYKYYDFLKRFHTGDITLTPQEQAWMEEHYGSFDDYFDSLDLKPMPFHGVYVEFTDYFSEISRKLELMGYNWYLMCKRSAKRPSLKPKQLSIRARDPRFDCNAVAAEYGAGGGHNAAGGLPLKDGATVEQTVSEIADIVEDLYGDLPEKPEATEAPEVEEVDAVDAAELKKEAAAFAAWRKSRRK